LATRQHGVVASHPSVASHLSAGWLWGLTQSRPGTIHITCRSPRPRKRPFIVHRADLARTDLARRDGIPVTALARTILDLAVDSRPRTVSRFIRKADDDKTFDLRAMEDLLARTKGHRGQAKVRAALEIYDETPVFTRSDLEKRFFEVVIAAGRVAALLRGRPGTGRRVAPRRDRDHSGDRAAARSRTRRRRRVGPPAPRAPERRVRRQLPPRPPSQKKGFGGRSP
jgi:hypothetical protein